MKRRLLANLPLLAMALAPVPALAAGSDLPDRVELGRNGAGDPCQAARYWNDPGAKDPFSISYSVTCRGATAIRHLGVVRSVSLAEAAAINEYLDCGAAATFEVAGLGMVSSRRCFDKLIGLETIETSMIQKKRHLSVSIIPSAQGPGEEALRLLAGAKIAFNDRNRTVAPAVQVATLAATPSARAAVLADTSTLASLEQGLRFIRTGLYMEASRTLNDALSRLPDNAPATNRIELQLAAALADSNLRFFETASEHFARADALLAANPGLPDEAILVRKRRTYAALDLLNRRKFNDVISALSDASITRTEVGQPLLDPAVVRAVNQSGASGGVEGVVATPDMANLSQLVIDAEAAWARSVALLGDNKPQESLQALSIADRQFAVLRQESKVNQSQTRWLAARIERQRARLLLRLGRQTEAVEALDRAVVLLEGTDTSGAVGSVLAETKLERAGVIARAGGPIEPQLASFEDAINSFVSSDSQGAILPPAAEQYLELLVADAKANPNGVSQERFFRTLQAAGNPAVARQFVELQTLAEADPLLAAKVKDEQDLEREVTRLRFQIDSGALDEAGKAKARQDRANLEAQLVSLQAELLQNKSYATVNDSPVTIQELRAALQPGEAYLKISKVRNYVFGMLIDAEGTQIYRVQLPAVAIEPLVQKLRLSIVGGEGAATTDVNKRPIYEVGTAYTLFQLLAGPAADRVLASKALIVDTAGVLETVPFGVLVADRASVDKFVKSRSRAQYDYSAVNFVGTRVPISNALSPRSLVVARNLAPSAAPLPFIGFGQHQPTPVTANLAGRMISIGSGCEVEASAIAALTRQLSPINARELTKAGEALGLQQLPEVTGAEFTDTAVLARTDLDQFQVLHFATHGLTEGQWGCSKSPPALVTTLGEGNSEGILSFGEIAKLKLDANLVVLSACNTAAGVSVKGAREAGQEDSGASLEGLVRAFLTANARAVLSTAWAISDDGESETLIQNFYGAARNGTIGEALMSAQQKLALNPDTSHPYYWGAFFLVGDSKKALLSGAAKAQTALAAPALSAVLNPR